MIKKANYKIRGMQRDFSESSFNPEFSFENKNIRITAREDNTLLSIVNEKGNSKFNLIDNDNNPIILQGTIIGKAVLVSEFVLFTTDINNINKPDYIYKFIVSEDENNLICKLLYNGKLNFNINNPIETLVLYENENLKKVYWVDGLNQPRVINIAEKDINNFKDTSFDFSQELKLEEQVEITKSIGYGQFHSGVIQYAFMYYNLYGQESNIFYNSPLYYTSYKDRGANPEESVSNRFNIKMTNLDDKFKYIRVFSIFRTSINGQPSVRLVLDTPIVNNSINVIDDGIKGSPIDATTLLYIGGEDLIANTLTQKDNTLFLGNLKLRRKLLDNSIKDVFKNGELETFTKPNNYFKLIDTFYNYNSSLNNSSFDITTFKSREWYRFGIQFQHKTGKWSEVLFINDKQIDKFPTTSQNVKVRYKLNNPSILTKLIDDGYIKARGVIVYPELTDRDIILQGVVNPTLYNVGDRSTNSPFSISSWIYRPMLPYDKYNVGSDNNINNSEAITLDNSYIKNTGSWAQFKHNQSIFSSEVLGSEIQTLYNNSKLPYLDSTTSVESFVNNERDNFFVDQSIVTLNSPELEFNDLVSSSDLSGLKFRIVGTVLIDSSSSYVDLYSTSGKLGAEQKGFNKQDINSRRPHDNINSKASLAGRKLLSSDLWYDRLYESKDSNKEKTYKYITYLWNRNGSLNNQQGDSGVAQLKIKKISNIAISNNTSFMHNIWESYIEDDDNHTGASIQLFDSNEDSIIRITEPLNSGIGNIHYKGNYDKILPYNRDRMPSGYPITYLGNDKHNIIDHTQTNIDYGTEPVRIKFKSTPHAVIAFNYTKDGKQLILPSGRTSNSNWNTLPGSENYAEWNLNKSTGYAKPGVKPFWVTNRKENTKLKKEIPLNYYYSHYLNGSEGSGNNGIPLQLSVDGQNWFEEYKDRLRIKENNVWKDLGYVDTNDNMYFKSESAYRQNLNYEELDKYFEPKYDSVNSKNFSSLKTYDNFIHQDNIMVGTGFSSLYLGELYRDNVVDRFGGVTDEAIENNIWYPAGESVLLNNNNDIYIEYLNGDTFFQKYDSLKTYPFTTEDQNQVVDILSFYVESQINLDGRYDKNRGQIDNINMTPQNFNLLNIVYSQQNNYFNYKSLNQERFGLNYFPNTVAWSKTKVLTEDIDTWTSINMASTMDLDGDKGVLQSLNKFNNSIIAFQDKGISEILFNSRVQIPTTDGLPIEISNSFKVDGKRYLFDNIGTTNKWSIMETPSGIYFVDTLNKSLHVFNGNEISLSNTLGFHAWAKNNMNNDESWNIKDFNNFVTFYDSEEKDIYFVNKDHCIVYSELIGQFISFYDYNNVPYMFNVYDKFISIKQDNNGMFNIWNQNNGDYNMFFEEFKPFYVKYLINPDMQMDKIFNNIEFRNDVFDSKNNLIINTTLDYMKVKNEYQEGEHNFIVNSKLQSNIKQKFRIWRAFFPREKGNIKNRIRNPWVYVELGSRIPNINKNILHDMVVYYTI